MSFRQTVQRCRQYLNRDRSAKRPKKLPRRLELEPLEGRMLLSSVPLNTTSWTAIGPAPINNGDTPGNMPVSGRITGIAADPNDVHTVYIAAAGGGVWKSTNAADPSGSAPVWTPLTDGNSVNWGSAQPVEFMGSITVDPVNAQIIYAGTGEADNSGDSFYGVGILKSTDGGQSWTLLTGNDPVQQINNAFNRKAVVKIVVDPLHDQTVYAAVANCSVNGLAGNTGIWESNDGGNTWFNTTVNQTAADSPSTNVDNFTDLVIDPNDPQTLFTAVGGYRPGANGSVVGSVFNGVYETQNGGLTWHRAGNFPLDSANYGRISLAIAMAGQFTLYAGVANVPNQNGNVTLRGIWKSSNDFAGFQNITWTPLSNVPNYVGNQGDYDNVLAVDPNNANVVYAAGQADGNSVLRSTDGGASWDDIHNDGDLFQSDTGPHADHHALTFDAGGRLLDGNDGGIWMLDNPGDPHWTDYNGNLQITQFNGIALDPFNPNNVFGASQDNGAEQFSGSLGWQQQQSGDLAGVRPDLHQQGTFYAMQYNSDGDGPFLRMTNGDGDYDTKTNNIPVGSNNTWGDPSNQLTPFAVDPSTTGHVVLGTDRVWQTTDRADDWTAISTPGQNNWAPEVRDAKGNLISAPIIDTLAIAATSAQTIYATVGGTLMVTTDGGVTWTARNLPGGGVSALAVSGGDSQTLYVTVGQFTGGAAGHVFKSTDGGQSWTDISGNLPDSPVNTLLLDDQDGSMYVGNDMGVYACNDSAGTSWYRFGTGLPNARVKDLQLDTTHQILAAATYGRGVWEIQKVPNLFVHALVPDGAPATEGQELTNVRVGVFSDPTGPDDPSNYIATILWGDGSFSFGTITAIPTLVGVFNVTGSHTYGEEGNYPLGIFVIDADQSLGPLSTVNLTVADAPLSATGLVNTATAGAAFSGNVATFTDADPNGILADYTATIAWGDGSSSRGTITADPAAPGQFDVSGTHPYMQTGSLPITVTITDAGGSSAVATGTANVNSLTVTGDPEVLGNTITLQNAPADPNSYQVLVNGQLRFTGLWSSVSGGISLSGDQTPYTFNIENIAQGTPVTVNTSTGDDTVYVSPFAKSLDSLNGSLTVNGGTGNDTLKIMDSSSSPQPGRFYNLENDSLQLPYLPGVNINYANIANVELDACTQSDQSNNLNGNQITIKGAVATTSLAINGGGFTDVLVVDFSAGSPIPGGGMTLDGGAGTNLLFLQADPYLTLTDTATGSAAGSLTFGNGLISLFPPTITYANVQSISDQAVAPSGPFALANSLSFNAPAEPSELSVSDGQLLSYGMTVISGTSLATGTPTCATLAFTNRNYATVNSADLTNTIVVNTSHAAAALTGLTINAGPGNSLGNYQSTQNTYVLGTPAGVTTTIAATNGWHDIFVGLPAGNKLGIQGTPLDGILGPVTVSGQAYQDVLDLYDSASTAQKTYTLNSTSIAVSTVNGAPVANPVPISWQGLLSTVALFGSTAADTYLIQSMPVGLEAMVVNGAWRANTVQSALAGNHTWWIYPNAGVTLDYGVAAVPVTFGAVWNLTGGPGADHFEFLPQYGQDGHLGGVIDGGGSTNTLDYSQYSTGVTVDLTGQNTPTNPTDPFGGLGTATGTAGVRHIQNVIGSRSNDTLIGDDEANVFMPNGGLDIVRGNGGDDTVRIWGPQDPRTSIDGGSGTNTLWAADFPNTWNVTRQNTGNVRGTIPGFMSGASFSHMQNLLGGLNTDTFRFAAGAGVDGWVNGNLGVNTLDYSTYTTPVTVNLSQFGTWGRAMNAPQGVMNFQIVLGSRTAGNTLTGSNIFATVLVGGAAADVLTAGTARAILIGGRGADVLQGGPADDLLIGGYTSFDTNVAALMQILAEWGSTDSFTDRVNYLSGAVVNHAHYRGPTLRRTGTNPTVFDDGSVDNVAGGGGMDWIIPS
jgi:hypothetical protein